MSTLKVAAINNPSASSGGLAISAAGNVTGAGLDLITTQSFSAVSSVSVNNCFTGDYDNYRVMVSFTPSASGQTFDLRLRASGTDLSTSVYSHAGVQVTTGAVVSGVAALAITNLRLSATASTTSPHATLFDIFAPNAASQKTVSFSSWRANGTSAAFVEQGAGFVASAVAHDGFSLSLSSGTITGTVSVYGYKK